MKCRAMCVLALLAVSVAQAAGSVHPDLSGFWNLSRGRPVQDPQLARRIAPNTVVLDDVGPIEFGILDFGGLRLKPDALARAKAWDIRQDMSVANACRIPSILYAMQGPFPIEIFQGTEFTVIRMEYFDMTRVIFTDGRPHLPAAGPHTKTGDSIGHWEGDTLVVETTHLKESTITNNGLDHSRKLRMIERFRLSDDRRKLLSTQEFEDPEVLENRGARFITWDRVEGDHVHAYDCDPSFAENYAN
ncbi:MAG: hypothetical protein RLZZ200_2246 [Pseudomonadota bacterium]|jgi:hypothetical protein